jgi:ankyrin repeat protein
MYAALSGSEAVVKMLLETGKADMERKDIAGRTALSWATEKGHHVIFKLLAGAAKKSSEPPGCRLLDSTITQHIETSRGQN